MNNNKYKWKRDRKEKRNSTVEKEKNQKMCQSVHHRLQFFKECVVKNSQDIWEDKETSRF